jgi:hypothetical protein
MKVEAMEEGEINDEAGEEVAMEDIKPKKLVTDDIMQSSDRDQSINKSWNHNQANERIEQGSIQRVESEAQHLGNDGTNNGNEDVGERFKSNRNGKFNDLCFKPLLSNG